MHEIFISYCQPDKQLALLVHDTLVMERFSVWMAGSLSGGVIVGNAFKDDIVNAITDCKVFILIYSDYVNRSRDVKNELTLAEKKIIIPVRADMSKMGPELLYDLKRLEYLDATGKDLTDFIFRLRTQVRMQLRQQGEGPKGSTDQMLFRRGLSLLRSGQYRDAQKALDQYSSIVPENAEARYYLALCKVAGQRIHKLDGLLVADIERMLTPFAIRYQYPKLNFLLALIKCGYYQHNNLRETAPGVKKILENVQLTFMDASELLELIHAPGNAVWNLIATVRNQTKT